MVKSCIACLEVKDDSEFYKHPRTASGLMGPCKSCHKARMRRRRQDKSAEIQAYDRERGLLPHRKAAVKERSSRYRAKRHNRVNDREKVAARTAVGNAVRDGALIKPPNCEACGAERDDLHGHHHDYSKPLDVTWLCPPCHGAEHRAANENRRLAEREFAQAA
ncbi:MAG TPA: hypothetical protein VEF90_17710 [Xanthobacteraceae bacterium]|nr:hypothetical protein [Xanthobacteraceae bacterium]